MAKGIDDYLISASQKKPRAEQRLLRPRIGSHTATPLSKKSLETSPRTKRLNNRGLGWSVPHEELGGRDDQGSVDRPVAPAVVVLDLRRERRFHARGESAVYDHKATVGESARTNRSHFSYDPLTSQDSFTRTALFTSRTLTLSLRNRIEA